MKHTNLIEIQTTELNNEAIQTVNARDLHSYLESKQHFTNWIQSRIADYGFIEGKDFLINLLKTPNGGRPSKEYFITIDMAKELSMVERNEKGKQARQYFIDCEKKSKQQPRSIKIDNSGLPEYRKAKAVDLLVKSAKECFIDLPNLGEKSKQTLYASLINPVIGFDVIPLPTVDKTYTATEVGEMLGVSSKKIGVLANQLDIKNSEYGIFVLDKSPYSSKQVESFRYNDKAIDLIKSELTMVV
ncbi:antA/AntB antirepressor family protein [Orbus mooreae]|uniref:antA/AntB antirepressor family protein n=1 Tax=Orbus mooreae TaxID=3074107 RepID=UPI00370D7D9E